MDFQGSQIANGPPAEPSWGSSRRPSTCDGCPVARFCLPSWPHEGEGLERLHIGRRRLRQGQAIYREGDRFQFVYAVRHGIFKSTVSKNDGRDQVVAFHLPGERFGFDGLADGRHPTTATAIEDAEACAISYSELNEAIGQHHAMRHQIPAMITTEFLRERRLASLMAKTPSDQRVATFLLNLAGRLHERGYAAQDVQLRMTQEDIGSYLGTTLETVSRCLSSFARQGYVAVHRRRIVIVDPAGLRARFGIGSAGLA